MKTFRENNLPGWYTCLICRVTYNPDVGSRQKHPHCTEKLESAHWVTRALLPMVFQDDVVMRLISPYGGSLIYEVAKKFAGPVRRDTCK